MRWPWQKSNLETRASQFDLALPYMQGKRQSLTLGATALSATVAAAAGMWSRAFSMTRAEPESAVT